MKQNLSNIYMKYVETTPDKIAVICDYNEITYKELSDEVSSLAGVLNDLGIKKGDRVGILSNNSIFYVIFELACFKIGAITVTSSVLNAKTEIINSLNHCKVKCYFILNELENIIKEFKNIAKDLKEKCPSIKKIVYIDKKTDAYGTFYEDLRKKSQKLNKFEKISEDSPAMIFYTSGSTGNSKGVVHTYKSLLSNAKFRAETLMHNSSDIFFTLSLICNGSANMIGLLPMLYVGGTFAMKATHTMDFVVSMLNKYKITHIGAAPSEWAELSDNENFKKIDFSNLKYSTTGGNTIPGGVQEKVSKITGVPLVSSLGMTECGGYMTTPPHIPAKKGSIGMPLTGIKVKLVDNNYSSVGLNEKGEILVKGENIMSHYYNEEELTKNAFIDGWFKTGDLASKDEEGYYYFEGRKKNIIIYRSNNIYPEEVANVLTLHPLVSDAVVIGVQDKDDEAVFAFIECGNNCKSLNEKILLEFCIDKLATFKHPKYFMFLDKFPTDTSLKKINLKKLKKMAEEYMKKNIFNQY